MAKQKELNKIILSISIPIIASIITLVTLIIILTERMNRAIAAMMGAVIMVLAGLILGFLF